MPLTPRTIACIVLLLIAVSVGVIGELLSGSAPGTLAASSTPQAMPSPIGNPPGPPTSTPVATPVSTAPATTPVATGTPAATAVTHTLSFSLDAVRVSKPGNNGDLSGLAAVRPGTKVWLMMYFTVRSLPRKETRVTTYTIQYNGKTVYTKSFQGQMKRTEIGRFSRYTVYDVPRTFPYGRYVFRATLNIGRASHAKGWKFRVARQELPATPWK